MFGGYNLAAKMWLLYGAIIIGIIGIIVSTIGGAISGWDSTFFIYGMIISVALVVIPSGWVAYRMRD